VAPVLAPLGLWLLATEMTLPGPARHFIVDEHILRFLGTRPPFARSTART
jgi:hypothetical protein